MGALSSMLLMLLPRSGSSGLRSSVLDEDRESEDTSNIRTELYGVV